jgi:hypothetical protein
MITRFAVVEYRFEREFDYLENGRITKLFMDKEKGKEYMLKRLIEIWREIIADKASWSNWRFESTLERILVTFLDEDFNEVPITDDQIITCIKRIYANPKSSKLQFLQLKEVQEL